MIKQTASLRSNAWEALKSHFYGNTGHSFFFLEVPVRWQHIPVVEIMLHMALLHACSRWVLCLMSPVKGLSGSSQKTRYIAAMKHWLVTSLGVMLWQLAMLPEQHQPLYWKCWSRKGYYHLPFWSQIILGSYIFIFHCVLEVATIQNEKLVKTCIQLRKA